MHADEYTTYVVNSCMQQMTQPPFWLLPPAATTTLMIAALVPRHAVRALGCVSLARNAYFTLREAEFTSHTARFLSVFLHLYFLVTPFVFYFCPHFGCCLASCAEFCQQGGGYTRTHFLYFLCFMFFLLTHSSIFRERVVRNDSLIQRLGRQRSVVVWR